MVLRILHPILASTLCAANPLARIAEPTIAYPLPLVVFYIESRRFLLRDSPRPATTYEQKTGGADGVKGA